MKHLMGKINNFLENYFFIPKGIAQKWYIILVIVGIALPVLFSLFGDNSKKDNPFSLTSQITILSPTPSVYISPTPFPDQGKKCSDGNQCQSGWCVLQSCVSELPPNGPAGFISLTVNGEDVNVWISDYSNEVYIYAKEEMVPLAISGRLCTRQSNRTGLSSRSRISPRSRICIFQD